VEKVDDRRGSFTFTPAKVALGGKTHASVLLTYTVREKKQVLRVDVYNEPTANFNVVSQAVKSSARRKMYQATFIPTFLPAGEKTATYEWFFEDGSRSKEARPVRTYPGGRYPIRLTVRWGPYSRTKTLTVTIPDRKEQF
jgi:hypothetical protein